MRRHIFAALAGLLTLVAAHGDDKIAAKGKDLDYDIHGGYFESNKSGLTGDASYLAFASQKSFDAVFGAAPAGDKQRFLPKDAFESKVVVAVIKRGKSIFDYKVDKVTNDDGVLTIQYTATAQPSGGGTATFATPLIVSVDKGKYDSVAFLEDGKKVATAKFSE